MSEQGRSEQACPVCGEHELALDQPPQIDVMGVQVYSDLLGMGDLPTQGAVGIVCLNCGARWSDRAAFDRNEPERDVSFEPSEEHFGGGNLPEDDDPDESPGGSGGPAGGGAGSSGDPAGGGTGGSGGRE